MIHTIADLAALTLREAADHPLIRHEIVLKQPGATAAEIAQIRRDFPELSADYLVVAGAASLCGVALGFLRPAPSASPNGTLLERLREYNANEDFHARPFLRDHHLTHVADYGGDMMCLVGPAGKRSGEVVRVDFSCPPDLTQHRTANSFTDLLIGMGRILEIRLTGQAGPGAIEQAMIALGSLNLDTEQLEDWRWFAEEQLGDG